MWIEEEVVTRGFQAPRLAIHSANPVGRHRMQRGIDAIARAGGHEDVRWVRHRPIAAA